MVASGHAHRQCHGSSSPPAARRDVSAVPLPATSSSRAQCSSARLSSLETMRSDTPQLEQRALEGIHLATALRNARGVRGLVRDVNQFADLYPRQQPGVPATLVFGDIQRHAEQIRRRLLDRRTGGQVIDLQKGFLHGVMRQVFRTQAPPELIAEIVVAFQEQGPQRSFRFAIPHGRLPKPPRTRLPRAAPARRSAAAACRQATGRSPRRARPPPTCRPAPATRSSPPNPRG
ncbi:hypothetical protein G6F59_013878 [Rhizopus arrhizus]|nr:hypothetical protein G6F59_013878 [Rhizopus arrhizus]